MIKNAEIRDASFGFWDNNPHGCLVLEIELDYGGSCQGFSIDGKDLDKVSQFLRLCGKTKVSNLQFSYIRAEIKDGLISAVGHILEDKWIQI